MASPMMKVRRTGQHIEDVVQVEEHRIDDAHDDDQQHQGHRDAQLALLGQSLPEAVALADPARLLAHLCPP
jgi:hypothetical protein